MIRQELAHARAQAAGLRAAGRPSVLLPESLEVRLAAASCPFGAGSNRSLQSCVTGGIGPERLRALRLRQRCSASPTVLPADYSPSRARGPPPADAAAPEWPMARPCVLCTAAWHRAQSPPMMGGYPNSSGAVPAAGGPAPAVRAAHGPAGRPPHDRRCCSFHPPHGPAARRPGHVRSVLDRHHLPGLPAAGPAPGGGRGGGAADHQRVPAVLRPDEPGARPAVRCLGPQAGDPRRPGGVCRRLGRLRAVHRPDHAAGVPRAAGPVGGCRHDRRPRGVDAVRHRPGDRADHRRLDPAQWCGLAADLLVPGGVRTGAAGGHRTLPAGNASGRGAGAAVAEGADARLRAHRLQSAFPAPGAGRQHRLRRHLPVHLLGAGVRDAASASGRGGIRLAVHSDHRRHDHRLVPVRAHGRAHHAHPPGRHRSCCRGR
ncbi:hypothetical protein G6F31_014116 [Rhizopus arrhizus]|nr:hypothetical protein G6F31_014116 [Rhizopus arrhizus]